MEDGRPMTAHTVNNVRCMIESNRIKSIADDGCLADIAPTVLKLMGVKKPDEMTGKSLVEVEN